MKKLIHKLFYRKTKVYISGKVSGCDLGETFIKFQRAEAAIWFKLFPEMMEWNIVNPVRIGLTEKDSWLKCMLITIYHLLPCSHIYMLKDWKESKGARIERWVAKKMFKTVIYEK